MQVFLIGEAEKRLGKRDVSKKIHSPSFHSGLPCIFNTITCDGAYAVLSENAQNYWPTAMYELAHETIHLLDPIAGGAKYLEEGFAVKFSVEMVSSMTNHPMQPPLGLYHDALNMVNQLPGNAYEIGALCRIRCRSLDCVSAADLLAINATITTDLASRLCVRP